MQKFTRIFHSVEEKLLMILLALMVITVFAEIIARALFNHGVLWAEEATLYLNAWFVILGASYGIRTRAHIGVDAFVKILPNRVARILGLIAVCAALGYCALMLAGSWVYISKLFKIPLELQDIPIKRWAANSVLIFGFSLLAVRLINVGWNIIKGNSIGFEHVDEAQESLEAIEQASGVLPFYLPFYLAVCSLESPLPSRSAFRAL